MPRKRRRRAARGPKGIGGARVMRISATRTTRAHRRAPAIRSNPHDRLNEVQERVYGGRTGLGPLLEAVATDAPVVGAHVERFGRTAFHDAYINAPIRQRSALKDGGDRRPRSLSEAFALVLGHRQGLLFF